MLVKNQFFHSFVSLKVAPSSKLLFLFIIIQNFKLAYAMFNIVFLSNQSMFFLLKSSVYALVTRAFYVC